MTTRLLEVFDPYVSKNARLVNWMTLPILILIINKYWLGLSTKTNGIKNIVFKNFYSIIKITPFNLPLPVYLIIVIASINIVGLLPYNFSQTRIPALRFSLAMFLLITTWINIFTLKLKKSLVHFVPKDSPIALIAPLVLIELVRLLIRPITLSIRLTANITAGHIILTLASELMDYKCGRILWPTRISPNIILVFIETGVRLIQALILSLLVTLYIQESRD